MFNNWGFENLGQFWTLFPHTPDNSFLGFVVEPSSSLSNVSSSSSLKKKNQAVVYGKEGWYSQGKEAYIDTIGETMQIHSTFKVGVLSDSHSTFWMGAAAFNTHGVITTVLIVLFPVHCNHYYLCRYSFPIPIPQDIDQSLSAHVVNHGVLPSSDLQRYIYSTCKCTCTICVIIQIPFNKSII